MNCMKCGRECREESVFCQDCLLEMDRYPIDPGSVVLLPRRRESTIPKKIMKRHVPTAEEENKFLRKCVLILTILLGICISAISLMAKPTLHYIKDEHVEIGQNYSTVISTVPSSAPASAE